MIDNRTAPYGVFLLRFVLGLLFLAHVGLKIFVFTPAGTAQFFGSLGLPPALAYFTIALELVVAVALVLGVWARLAALPVTIPPRRDLYRPSARGLLLQQARMADGNFPRFWIVALLPVALIGDGAFAMVPTPAFGASEADRRRRALA